MLNCLFENDVVWHKYSCSVQEIKLEFSSQRITRLVGSHYDHKTDDEVISVRIEKLTTINYFTRDFFIIFPNIKFLVIHESSLVHLKRRNFEGAENVKVIHINHNLINSLEDHVFEGAENSKVINLRENQIEEISQAAFNGLRVLKYLTLSYNKIKSLHKNTFSDLIYLEQLGLGSNQLYNLNEQLFHNNRHLEIIFLDNNLIESLNGNIFKNNKQLKEIYLDNNKIKHITDHTKFLVNLKDLKVAVFKNNTCVDTMIIIDHFIPPYENIFLNCRNLININENYSR